MTLAERLVELRLRSGMSQEQLSERSGVSARTIGDLERGTTRRPQRETLRALIGTLGLDAAETAELDRLGRAAPPASTRRTPRRPPALAAPMTSLVGREPDLSAITALIRARTTRLVTVTGPGGVGKSRLALEAGWQAAPVYDQVAGVDLSPLPHARDVLRSLTSALGCRIAGLEPADALAAFIGDGRWLLVLDSFERVLGAAAELADLLARCRALTILVTSRMPLSLRGEHLWPLAPLPLPEAAETDLETLRGNPAVSLLVQRTAAARPGFAVSGANAVDVVGVCRRLDGLPLAIELAAAHLRTQEPADLIAGWTDRLGALSGAVDVPDRHQTLRHTVQWSTDHLAEPERVLLGLLAVFAGGASPAAVRAVLQGCGQPVSHVDASIGMLVSGSLVAVVDRGGAARITMLDTIREVAVELLATAGLADAVRDAHAAHFLELIRQGGSVESELDNCRAALDRATGHQPQLLDVALVRGLNGFFFSRAMFAEALLTFRAIAAAAPDEQTGAWAWHGAAIAANESGRSAEAVLAGRECADRFDRLDDDLGRSMAVTVLGNAYKFLGEYEQARASHTTGLELARKLGDDRRATISLNNLGTLAHDRGEYDTARAHYGQSLEIKRRLGDERGTAITLMNLGGVENDLGEWDRSHEHLAAALTYLLTIDDPSPATFALAMDAEALLGLGRVDEAGESAQQSLKLAREAGYRPGIAMGLARLGDVALARGEHDAAADLLHQALEDASGAPEQARILDRLARADPARAGEFQRRAAHVRREHDIPVPPVDRAAPTRV